VLLSFFCCIAVVAITGFVSAAPQEGGSFAKKAIFTKHFNKTLFDITENSAYSVEVLLDDSEYRIGKNTVGIIVHNAGDEDVKGADLDITLKNLQTGENSARTVRVKDKKNGLYIVSGLDLPQEGRWELAITVKKGGVSGGVKFVLPDALKERVSKGRYSP
jgi:hypothetical protein